MHNITLIGTYHIEKGACNVDELYKIVDAIKPDVIFEEIPPSFFDRFYIKKTDSRLESDTINRYLEKHRIEHIPVDYDDYDFLIKIVNENKIAHEQVERRSRTYRFLCDQISQASFLYGFKFLNSIESENFHRALDIEVIEALKEFKNENNIVRNDRFNEIMTHKRENIMLDNIYQYCMEHDFNTGLFFIGSAHRYTIIEKIQKYETEHELKINWNYRNYEGIIRE